MAGRVESPLFLDGNPSRMLRFWQQPHPVSRARFAPSDSCRNEPDCLQFCQKD